MMARVGVTHQVGTAPGKTASGETEKTTVKMEREERRTSEKCDSCEDAGGVR